MLLHYVVPTRASDSRECINLPSEREPAVVPRKRLRKVLQEKEPEGRVEVALHFRVTRSLVPRVLHVIMALGVQPAWYRRQEGYGALAC